MFQEATSSYNPRSIVDTRTQPWRSWWPVKSQNGAELQPDAEDVNFNEGKNSVLLDTSNDAPWVIWKFDNDQPWTKPWAHWPLNGNAQVAPEPVHDPTFTSESLQHQSPDAISAYRPFRTTSIVQFFKQNPGHEKEKPYACRVPVSSESRLQSNFEGNWSQIMLTDVRGHEDLFTLDVDGFEWLQHISKINVLESSFDVHLYMQEMSEFFRGQFHSQKVFIYDYVQTSPSPADRKSGFSDVTRRIPCGKLSLTIPSRTVGNFERGRKIRPVSAVRNRTNQTSHGR
ncbi:hypothetical protein NHQ30_006107 [Ciborinia camelliae]|nr:hypothetical protein NHQ30_006107 [Ciborinia camelliae]